MPVGITDQTLLNDLKLILNHALNYAFKKKAQERECMVSLAGFNPLIRADFFVSLKHQ
jgi:hypothetical protein